MDNYSNYITIKIEPENNFNSLEVKAIIEDTKPPSKDEDTPKEDEPSKNETFKDDNIPKNDDKSKNDENPSPNSSKKSNIQTIIVIICAVIFLIIIVIVSIIRRKSSSRTLSLINAIDGGPIYYSTPLTETQPQQ